MLRVAAREKKNTMPRTSSATTTEFVRKLITLIP